MSKLQTQVVIPSPCFSISYSDEIMLLGSCFATNIGQYLSRLKFNVNINPFGVIYNPASIAQSINLLVDKKTFTESDLISTDELWFSFSHHTSFSSPDKIECLDKINQALREGAEAIRNAGVIFITIGTAWAFQYRKTGNIVSNCHKLPTAEFEREFLEMSEIVNVFTLTFNKILSLNKNAKLVLTVSPIRHWKDGAIENMRSKAALVLAVKELEKKFSQLYYFPVYEIFMDELRDYRFYAGDMLHPSEFAVEYIWEKFVETFFDSKTLQQANEIEKLRLKIAHRVMNRESISYKKFIAATGKMILELKQKYPELDFSAELKQFSTTQLM